MTAPSDETPVATRALDQPPARPDLEVGVEVRRIRKYLRHYSARSVVALALDELWTDRGSKMENLRSAPWITLLLVKWALQDRTISMKVGQRMPAAVFDALRQQLWELPAWRGRPDRPLRLAAMIRPMLQQQLEYQRAHGWGFLRWPALIARLPVGARLAQHFRETLGMDPDTYIDLSFALYASVVNGEQSIPSHYLYPLRQNYGGAVDRLLELFVRDLPALRDELQKPEAQQVRGRAELYEFAYLRRFPFVRLKSGVITCWHPMVLARGLEDAVHLRLSDRGEQYTRPFSRLFEAYATELAVEAAPQVVTEVEYEGAMGSEAPKVEAVIQEDGCNVLVEAKMALFADPVLVTDDADTMYRKTKRVYEAVHQGWKVTRALGQSTNPFHRAGVVNYLLVVTSRQLHLGHGGNLTNLYPTDKLDYPDENAAARLPLNNVFILSIEEFERTMGAVQAGDVKLPDLLRKAARDNGDPVEGRMYFSHYLEQHVKRYQTPVLIADAVERSKERLAAMKDA
ncbi:GapS1 family protein [Ramlibacter sp. Leaf400]|uniref:GapS1 family protein n=1 Tax=Ramlibacter sp. Leaf400 TaxID=1736365 RepID=UPI0006F7C2E2|nr:hypothetical protein [Ramlibacter sp. Leaf400]KQT10326.1 hypothetical protein ASG30_10800 [Ramlibacter sp. Leaf400]